MDTTALAQSPFAVVTFIVAPALLTNASSVLAMSTINRMLRTRDRMHDLYAHSETVNPSGPQGALLLAQVNRVESQALLLLGALRCIYVALGSFAAATLVTLVGAALSHQGAFWFRAFGGAGLLLGMVGVGGLMFGSTYLFRATQISLVNIREEAAQIRERQAKRNAP